jgi:hypothetical protein
MMPDPGMPFSMIRDICNKHIENGIPGSGKLLVNRHHLIRDICPKAGMFSPPSMFSTSFQCRTTW